MSLATTETLTRVLAAALSHGQRIAALSAATLPPVTHKVTADEAADLIAEGLERLGVDQVRQLEQEMAAKTRESLRLTEQLQALTTKAATGDVDTGTLERIRQAEATSWRERGRLYNGTRQEARASHVAYALSNAEDTHHAQDSTEEPVYYLASGPATDLSDLDVDFRPGSSPGPAVHHADTHQLDITADADGAAAGADASIVGPEVADGVHVVYVSDGDLDENDFDADVYSEVEEWEL